MLDKYIFESLNILRVYGVVNGRCGCGIVACKAPGKHPAPWRGVKTNRGVYNAKPAKECEPSDFDRYNLGVACGNGLIVVDIDPRNGGHFAWHDISKGQYLPDTWQVTTGSGGIHIYYRLPAGMTVKSQSFRGIDIQSTGKYVVAPPSMHREGGSYDWSEDSGDTIAQIPPWLVTLLRGHEAIINAGIVDDDTGGLAVPAEYEWPLLESILDQLTPRIGYDAWVSVGMGLHSTGADRAFHLWDRWSAKDPDQYNADDCARKWKSFKILPGQRYTYRYLYSLAELYGIKYSDDAFLSNWKTTPVTFEVENTSIRFGSVPRIEDLDHGPILNTLMNYFLEPKDYSVGIQIFALASSLQILSAAAQGSYKSPTSAALSLYQWISGRAGTGKDFYVNNTSEWIGKVNKNILSGNIGSIQGFRIAFQAFNSLVYVKDEWHETYKAVSTSKNENLSLLLSDYKTVFSAPPKLDKVTIKTGTQPQINNPIFGIFGAGTVKGLSDCGRMGDFLSSGLASRFLFWILPKGQEDSEEFKCNGNLLDEETCLIRLREIFNFGKVPFGDLIDSDETVAQLQATLAERKPSKKAVFHKPVIVPTNVMQWGEGARDLWVGIKQRVKDQVKEIGRSDDDDEDTVSILRRIPLMVVKLASLRALSDGRDIVTTKDVEWGHSVSLISSDGLLDFFKGGTGGVGKNDAEKYAMILRVHYWIKLQGKPVTKAMILNAQKIPERSMDESLLHLIAANRIECLDRKGNPVYPSKILGSFAFVAKQ